MESVLTVVFIMRETGGKKMKLCPFCRIPPSSSNEEEVNRAKKLMEKDNADAFNLLAQHYVDGTCGMPQDWAKARSRIISESR